MNIYVRIKLNSFTIDEAGGGDSGPFTADSILLTADNITITADSV